MANYKSEHTGENIDLGVAAGLAARVVDGIVACDGAGSFSAVTVGSTLSFEDGELAVGSTVTGAISALQSSVSELEDVALEEITADYVDSLFEESEEESSTDEESETEEV